MLKLAGEIIEGQLADHLAELDAHTKNWMESFEIGDGYICNPLSSWGTQAFSANYVYGQLFYLPRTVTFDRIAVEVTTLAADKSARLGIWTIDESDMEPNTLSLDAGEVSVATTGIKAITISKQLTKGLYFLGAVSDGTPTLRAGIPAWSPGGLGPTNFSQIMVGYNGSHTYAALPDPFPTANRVNGSALVIVALRPSSLD